MTGLRPGLRLRSVVDETEVIVVRAAPGEPGVLGCGGHAMVTFDEQPPVGAALNPAFSAGTAIGKRFAHPDREIEVLCTKSGQGSLTVDGELLEVKAAKALPSSD